MKKIVGKKWSLLSVQSHVQERNLVETESLVGGWLVCISLVLLTFYASRGSNQEGRCCQVVSNKEPMPAYFKENILKTF